MNDFVTLTCPSCGGKLQITNDIEQFVCGHCGNEHVVRRSGGIIAIAPIIDGIKKVQAGTDKTASELAIKRLREELAILRLEREKLILSITSYTSRGSQSHGFFEDLHRGMRFAVRSRVITDYMKEKGMISNKKGQDPSVLLKLSTSENFEEIEHRAQVLFSRSGGEDRKAYEELIEWCKEVKVLMQTIQDKLNELKLHEQRVKT